MTRTLDESPGNNNGYFSTKNCSWFSKTQPCHDLPKVSMQAINTTIESETPDQSFTTIHHHSLDAYNLVMYPFYPLKTGQNQP